MVATAAVTEIVIYGAGGSAREIAWLVRTCQDQDNKPKHRIVCFIDDDPGRHGELVNEIPIFGLEAARKSFPHSKIVGGVGNPRDRKRLMARAADVGFQYETIIHSTAQLSDSVEVGEGTVIYPGNILTTNIKIGRHVQTNVLCTISHDVLVGDYVTLGPGVHISGWVEIGAGVTLGAGSIIANGSKDRRLTIGANSVVGAGACVIRPVPPDLTVIGVPAKPIR